MEKQFLKDALFSGMTSNAFKLGTVLGLGWFWPRIAGCSVLYRPASMDQQDLENILVVAKLNTGTISPPAYLPHDNNTKYFYVVRRVNGCGYLEHTIAAAVSVSIDADGSLAESQPNKVFDWSVKQAGGNRVQLLWYYCPIGQKSKPVCFMVYCDGGTGQIDYGNPIARIDYEERRYYSCLTDALDAGRYLFAVRAQDAEGTADNTLAQLKIQLNITSPNAINILSAEAV